MTPDARFELREHTADVGVWASADGLESLFSALADGLAAASCETTDRAGGERFSLSVRAESIEALLFEYLDELIYLRDVRLELPVDNAVEELQGSDDERAEYRLEASARGLPVGEIDAREIKAVTYSEMRVESVPTGFEGYVVFDV